MSDLTPLKAYRKGRRARAGSADWDVALTRFSSRHCERHTVETMCELEYAWCDGWDDAQENNRTREPTTTPEGGSHD